MRNVFTARGLRVPRDRNRALRMAGELAGMERLYSERMERVQDPAAARARAAAKRKRKDADLRKERDRLREWLSRLEEGEEEEEEEEETEEEDEGYLGGPSWRGGPPAGGAGGAALGAPSRIVVTL